MTQDWFDLVSEDDFLDLETIFRFHADEEGIPNIPTSVWEGALAKFGRPAVQEALACYLSDNGIPFPYRQIPLREARQAFAELRAADWNAFLRPFDAEYQARYPYPMWSKEHGLAVCGSWSGFNVISDHYQQTNRYACPGYASRSALSLWSDRNALLKMNWSFWRFTKLGLNRSQFRASFALTQYVAMQFKPSAAKALYGWLGQGVILDPSCGWGDRLAGFYCSDGSHTYLGCDPNEAVWHNYKKQAVEYDQWLGGSPVLTEGTIKGVPYFQVEGAKKILIFLSPAEDAPFEDVVPSSGVDLVFTSPPYFGVEKYAEGTACSGNQSWSRYPTFESWLNDFLLTLFPRLASLVNDTGFCAVNIVDPLWKGRRLEVCQPLHDTMTSNGMTYAGFMAMPIKKRLSPKGDDWSSDKKFAEPIWIFRKGAPVPRIHPVDVFDIFGNDD